MRLDAREDNKPLQNFVTDEIVERSVSPDYLDEFQSLHQNILLVTLSNHGTKLSLASNNLAHSSL